MAQNTPVTKSVSAKTDQQIKIELQDLVARFELPTLISDYSTVDGDPHVTWADTPTDIDLAVISNYFGLPPFKSWT